MIHDTEHWLQIMIEHDPKDLTKQEDLSGLLGEELDQPGKLGFFPLPSSRRLSPRSNNILYELLFYEILLHVILNYAIFFLLSSKNI